MEHTAPRPLLGYRGLAALVSLALCSNTAARQAATQLGFLFGALRPTLAQNSFPFMGLGMVEIRACSDFDFFFFLNFF